MFRSRARSTPHGTAVPQSNRVSRRAIAFVLAAFLVLTGPGSAWALWTATTSTSTTAAAARVDVKQEVIGLDTVYPAGYSGTSTTTGSVTVSNTGSVPGTGSVTISRTAAPVPGDLASAVSVKVWQGDCAAGPGTTTLASLPITVTKEIGPAASATWCVQTSLDKFAALQHWGKSASLFFAASLTATGSSWTATAPLVGVTQSAGAANASDPVPPTPPLTVCTTPNNGQRLNLAWSPVSGFTSYTVKVTGPAPSTSVATEFPAATSPIELTKQQITVSGTYVITVYAGTVAIANDQFTSSGKGDLACR